MIIDTHIHERTFSFDSEMSLEDIVDRAKSIGLDGICITDHESNGLRARAEAYAKESDFLIIVGAEILTHEGDITVFGLDVLPEKLLHAQELVDRVIEAGGVCMSAHPFRENNRGMGKHITSVKGLSGVESFNGSTPHHHNMTAYHLAKSLKLPQFGASDAHVIEKIGTYATWFPCSIKTEKEFIAAVKAGDTIPVALSESGYKAFNPKDKLALLTFSQKYDADFIAMDQKAK